MRTVKRRTITGCLTCRRRKKKCDEVKPVCTGCERNFLQCEWPDYSDGRIRRRRMESDNLKPEQTPQKLLLEKNSRQPDLQFNIIKCKSQEFFRYGRLKWQFELYTKGEKSDTLYKFDDESQNFVPIDEFPKDGFIEPSIELDDNPLDILGKVAKDFWEYNDVNGILDLQLDSFQTIDVPSNALVLHPSNYNLTSHYQIFQDLNAPETHVYKDILRRYKNNELLSDSFLENVDIEALLFYACLNGYIPKLGTQYTHSSLTADAIFIPQVENNPLMRQVFLCCGATYLAWKDLERFQPLSDDLYRQCRQMIQEYITTNKNYADEDWLFASLQLLCNRDKNSFSGTVDDSTWHLTRAYQIIRKKYYTKTLCINNPVLDHLGNTNLILQPHERMFIESFIYHYSISILFVREFHSLPTPFVIFKDLNVVLKCPVYNCEKVAEWMSNPLLGSSLDTLEILAKVSYIARMKMPLDPVWLERVAQLRNMCIYYTPPMTLSEMDELQWFNFKINSMVGILITKSCYLFASKMINYDFFDVNCNKVQECVREIIQCYREIPETHKIWGILPWPMLITGAFARDPRDQESILWYINLMAERAHSYCGVKMASFLHEIWNANDTPHGGMNYLFDRDRLSQVDL